ncbi:MAG: site-specific integrase [Dethiobacter sp.]|nr:site-specific integrase [Dethiobacter sp.]
MKRAKIRKRILKKGEDGNVSKYNYLVTIELGRNHITGKRERLCKSAPTRKEAEAIAKKLEDSLIEDKEENKIAKKPSITVAEQLKRYLNVKRSEIRIRTWERYERIAVQHLIPALGDVHIQDLTQSMIQDYIAFALEEGRFDGMGGLSGTTVRQHRIVLSGALDLALVNGTVASNPVSNVPPPRVGDYEARFLHAKELIALLECLSVNRTRLYVPVYLAAVTGMRLSETLAIRWRDIDFAGKSIQVSRGLHIDKSGGYHFCSPKSKSSKRSISITEEDIVVLRNHFQEQQKEKDIFASLYNDEGLVCAKPDGNPMSPFTVSSNFSRTAKNMCLNVSFRSLRHTHATLLLAAAESPKYVSARLGHSKTAFTEDVYGHIIPNIDQKTAVRFRTILESS